MSGYLKNIAAIIAARFRVVIAIGIVAILFIWGVNKTTATIAIVGFFAIIVPGVISAFFGISKNKTLTENLKSVIFTLFNGVVYSISDYWLAWMLWGLVAILFKSGLDYWNIVIWVWIYDMVAATAYIIIDSWYNKNITQSRSYRASIDETMTRSRVAGISYIIYVTVRAIVWDGPERIILIFRKELNSPIKRIGTLIGMTLIQALYGAKLYTLGTESVSEAIKIFFK